MDSVSEATYLAASDRGRTIEKIHRLSSLWDARESHHILQSVYTTQHAHAGMGISWQDNIFLLLVANFSRILPET